MPASRWSLENYILKLQIEARVLLQMARGTILPAAIDYQSQLLLNVQSLNDVFGEDAPKYGGAQLELVKQAGALIQQIHRESWSWIQSMMLWKNWNLHQRKPRGYAEKMFPSMEALGATCAQLEVTVDDALWPLPKFTELLFTR